MGQIEYELDESTFRAELIERVPHLRGFVDSKIPAKLRNTISTDDVLQDIWISALRARRSLRVDSLDAIDRWLTTVAQNRMINIIRSATSIKRGGSSAGITKPLPSDSFVALFDRLSLPIQSPSRESALHEASKLIRLALNMMPQARRFVIMERYLHGKSCEEIAVSLQRSKSAVHSLLYNALQELQELLGPAYRYLSDSVSSDLHSDSQVASIKKLA
jgi:RNA polymerase sigma factor (sigma-70 family)